MTSSHEANRKGASPAKGEWSRRRSGKDRCHDDFYRLLLIESGRRNLSKMSSFGGTMREYLDVSLDRFDGENLESTVYFLSHKHEGKC